MTPGPDLLIKNVTLPDGRIADVSVADGVVSHIGAGLRADIVIEGNRRLCLPGGVDMHVHMRGGPQSEKETWSSGSRSALAGGVTVVIDQPNQVPPVRNPPSFQARREEAERESLCNFGINGAVRPDADIEGLWRAGATAFGETFAAASSYGEAVGYDALAALLRRIRPLGALVTIHAEKVREGQDVSLSVHNALRTGTGEAEAVSEVANLNPEGGALHFCHLSCIHAIDAACGSIEVTPHHLFLSYEMFADSDGRGKVNPPLRSEKARKKVWSRWERIDVIASDHAPHTRSEKNGAFPGVPSGIPGVETMIPLLLAAVYERRISLASVVEKTSSTPARLLGMKAPGCRPGCRADLALYPEEPRPVDPDALHSRAGWSPYAGMPAVFPDIVLVSGDIAFDNGDFSGNRGAWLPGRGYLGDHTQK
ncbi:MAG: amidohydrolase family protein [Methanomicrobiales archaeon]|nr:amidohydrolase family protein [Methanomicrobiales archaeon]